MPHVNIETEWQVLNLYRNVLVYKNYHFILCKSAVNIVFIYIKLFKQRINLCHGTCMHTKPKEIRSHS